MYQSSSARLCFTRGRMLQGIKSMFHPHQMGIYFHWPFCKAKCPYCDFNVHVREGEIDHELWCSAYIKALDYYAKILPDRQVVSVFFGGGTPSLMAPETVENILNHIRKNWRIANDFEVTLEANPTSVEIDTFKSFRAAGVNRISLGVQALNDSDLKFLGRKHSSAEALKAIDIAAETFDRYSFDLIYARPNQTLNAWEKELKAAIKYARGHMSLYQLTIERSTPFYLQYRRGEFQIPDDVEGAEFYNLTQDILADAGLPAYEISNHAAVGQECRHNLLYWNYADYIGIGPGAHGRFILDGQKRVTRDHSAPDIWLDRVQKQGQGAHPFQAIAPEDCFSEILMMGLRLNEGLSFAQIKKLSGFDFHDNMNSEHLARTQAEGWVEVTSNAIRLTREGMLRFNSLLPYILK